VSARYIVWIKESAAEPWVEQGDGPMAKATAERIAREIRTDFRISVRVVPAGVPLGART
jgi:hypothetical protein